MQELLTACNSDDAPEIYVEEGDNKIGIFATDIGCYKIVAFSFAEREPVCLLDQDYSGIALAIERLNEFLHDEYAGR